jgi:hypothetical protein
LVAAVAAEGDAALLWDLAAREDEFLALCGVVGLGRLAAEGDRDAVATLHERASDRRWRVREAVAMAMQRLGDSDIQRLVAIVEAWAGDGPLERRAAVAAICEPRLLHDPPIAAVALDVLERVTASLTTEPERRADDVRILRKALGYCWSVAVAADPANGLPRFLALSQSGDPDVVWIARQNASKARLMAVLPR